MGPMLRAIEEAGTQHSLTKMSYLRQKEGGKDEEWTQKENWSETESFLEKEKEERKRDPPVWLWALKIINLWFREIIDQNKTNKIKCYYNFTVLIVIVTETEKKNWGIELHENMIIKMSPDA